MILFSNCYTIDNLEQFKIMLAIFHALFPKLIGLNFHKTDMVEFRIEYRIHIPNFKTI